VKDTYLDIKAQFSTGETVIIEMQVLNVEGFEKRILYNAAKAYSIQLNLIKGTFPASWGVSLAKKWLFHTSSACGGVVDCWAGLSFA
jgi:hypothetical protein